MNGGSHSIQCLSAVPRAMQARASGDDAQVAKSGELPAKTLVGVDAIRKACLTNLDGAEKLSLHRS
jgi:hypothetical protein